MATDYGSVTSHTALLAKALEIPAVVALREATPNLRQGDPILIDGTRGILILNPNEEDLAQYQRFADERKTIE
ncbi:MAG: phosphoenolpyruvate--protein phosphotransferase, partial [Nitrospinaceae bacterium]|nr:phosphoenolpyruvate--protein phosphotransferase [Nitrospinaceae bacterium]